MTSAMIRTPEDARAFLTAGRAVLTLKSLRTGDHLTFKVKAATKPGSVSHFVSVRAGFPGENKFSYLGTISDTAFRIGRREKTPFGENDRQPRAFKFLLENLVRNQMPPSMEIWHEGQCGRCGRALTHPTSIASGIGPECARKMDR
jgi:hypothetical protein